MRIYLFIVDVLCMALMTAGMEYVLIQTCHRESTFIEGLFFVVLSVFIRIGDYAILLTKWNKNN